MKKFLFLPFLLFFIIASSSFWFYKNAQPLSESENFDFFLIEKGKSATQIGKDLQSSGFIKSALAFKVYIQFTGQTSRLQAGEFRLTPSYSLFQTVSTLTSGPVELWVTIPEGLRREEVAQKFARVLDKDSDFTSEFLATSKEKEGTLFPDTYLFPKEASASAIVNKLTRTFSSKTSELTASSGLSFKERVVLASIIERETKTAEERPVVAGILINRLELGMPLQVDATVQYAIGTEGEWWPILTRDDLEISSPFNTYEFTGLPPAPIASPGLSSLRAAFEPEASDYLYYIHDREGQIHYAKTLSEHNLNVSKYLGK